MEQLNIKKFTVNRAENLVKDVMDKLGFQLPIKLMAPATFFAISNIVSSEIKVNERTVSVKFDPTTLMLNEDVSKQLDDIQHIDAEEAVQNDQFAYLMNFDQNIVNSILGHIGVVK